MSLGKSILLGSKESILSGFKRLKDGLLSFDENAESLREQSVKLAGVFQMLELDFLQALIDEINQAISEGRSKEGKDRQVLIDALIEGVEGAEFHFKSILDSEEENSGKLYEIFKKIREARGNLKTTPFDVFFPPIGKWIDKIESSEEIDQDEEKIKQGRQKFLQAFVKWTRGEHTVTIYAQMMSGLDLLKSGSKDVNYILFWKVVKAFLIMIQRDSTEKLELKTVMKISSEVSSFSNQKSFNSIELMRIMLYLIAQTKQEDPEIIFFKETLGLQDYWDHLAVGMRGEDYILKQEVQVELRDLLVSSKEEFNKLTSLGTSGNNKKWEESLLILRDKLNLYSNATIKKNIDALVLVSKKATEKTLKITESIAEEIAFLYVLIEMFIEKRGRWDLSRDKLSDLGFKRLSAAIKGQVEFLVDNPIQLDYVLEKENEKVWGENLRQKLREDIREICDGLDHYIKNEDDRDEGFLTKTLELTLKIKGIFEVLEVEKIDDLLNRLINEVESLKGKDNIDAEIMQRLATGFGGVELYLDGSVINNSSGIVLLEKVISWFENDHQDIKGQILNKIDEKNITEEANIIEPTNVDLLIEEVSNKITVGEENLSFVSVDCATEEQDSVILEMDPIEEDKKSILLPSFSDIINNIEMEVLENNTDSLILEDKVPLKDRESLMNLDSDFFSVDNDLVEDVIEDEEMGDVFLEEIQEIIKTLSNLNICARNGDVPEDFRLEIKRGMHTIKGSGRMVGLNEIGRVAANLESLFIAEMTEDVSRVNLKMFDLVDSIIKQLESWSLSLKDEKCAKVDHHYWDSLIENYNKEQVEFIEKEFSDIQSEDIKTETLSDNDAVVNLDFSLDSPIEISLTNNSEPQKNEGDVSENFNKNMQEFSISEILENENQEIILVSNECDDSKVNDLNSEIYENLNQDLKFKILENTEGQEDYFSESGDILLVFRNEMSRYLDELFSIQREGSWIEKYEDLVRIFHTVKSLGNTVGYPSIGEIGEVVENTLQEYPHFANESLTRVIYLLKDVYENADESSDPKVRHRIDDVLMKFKNQQLDLEVISSETEEEATLINEVCTEIETVKNALGHLQSKLSILMEKLKTVSDEKKKN